MRFTSVAIFAVIFPTASSFFTPSIFLSLPRIPRHGAPMRMADELPEGSQLLRSERREQIQQDFFRATAEELMLQQEVAISKAEIAAKKIALDTLDSGRIGLEKAPLFLVPFITIAAGRSVLVRRGKVQQELDYDNALEAELATRRETNVEVETKNNSVSAIVIGTIGICAVALKLVLSYESIAPSIFLPLPSIALADKVIMAPISQSRDLRRLQATTEASTIPAIMKTTTNEPDTSFTIIQIPETLLESRPLKADESSAMLQVKEVEATDGATTSDLAQSSIQEFDALGTTEQPIVEEFDSPKTPNESSLNTREETDQSISNNSDKPANFDQLQTVTKTATETLVRDSAESETFVDPPPLLDAVKGMATIAAGIAVAAAGINAVAGSEFEKNGPKEEKESRSLKLEPSAVVRLDDKNDMLSLQREPNSSKLKPAQSNPDDLAPIAEPSMKRMRRKILKKASTTASRTASVLVNVREPEAKLIKTSTSSTSSTPLPSRVSVPPRSVLDAFFDDFDADAPSSECANAITAYLDGISIGSAKISSAPTVAITMYLDALSLARAAPSSSSSSAAAVSSYVDAVSSGVVTVPSPKNFKSYLDALSRGEVERPRALVSITSYIDFLTARTAARSVADAFFEDFDADAPTTICATAITAYFDGLFTGAAKPSSAPLAAITLYIDNLSSAGAANSLLSSSAVAVSSYVDALSSGVIPAPNREQFVAYLDALSTGEIEAPQSAKSITTYLDALPTVKAVTPLSVASTPPTNSKSIRDAFFEECNADKGPSLECGAAAITGYLNAISTGRATPAPEPITAISTYIDGLSPGGVEVASVSSILAMTAYLNSFTTGNVNVPSSVAVGAYLTSISTGEITLPQDAKAITTYFDVFAEINERVAKSSPTTDGSPGRYL